MTGAMYAAVSGLKAHMNKLNVIGNNVANANTYGYKSARTTFQESIYNSVRSGSNGSATTGGVNPAQMGYGCSIGTIDLDMGTQSYVPTGRGMDCMINGDGFFMVGSKPTVTLGADGTYTVSQTDPQDLMLTRVGNFKIDAEGYLTDGGGNVLYGFVTVASTTTTANPPVVTPTDEPGIADKNAPALSTQLVPLRLPMAAKEPAPDADPTAPGYIAGGTAIFPGLSDDGNNLYDVGGANGITTGKTIAATNEAISIDGATGKVTCAYGGETLVLGYIPLAKVTNINGLTHTQGPYFQAGEGAGDCTVASIMNSLDGKFLGNAEADDPGAERIFSAGDQTALVTNGLEASGTDIASEFSEMISTQRGYQANTRIITVTDSMLEELVNMKR